MNGPDLTGPDYYLADGALLYGRGDEAITALAEAARL
jgi:hypothetical protein